MEQILLKSGRLALSSTLAQDVLSAAMASLGDKDGQINRLLLLSYAKVGAANFAE